MAALNALRAVQTFDDKKRGTADAMAYSVSVGVTTNADMGAFNLPGTPDLQGSFEADTLASADQCADVRRRSSRCIARAR